ncbi:MAG: regulatory subunit-like protein [Thermoleophilia bacterium]|nr:regulatory subunit-like protein [Thermoleophilia bacterium]
MTIDPEPDAGSATRDAGLWGRLDERLGLVSMRPCLADDVRLRNIGEDWELVQISTRRVVPLDPRDVPVVRLFDGDHSIAEIIVAGIGSGRLDVEPVLRLVDRLVRTEMLAQYPPDLYRQVINHLARITARDRVRSGGTAPRVALPTQAAQVTPAGGSATQALLDAARLEHEAAVPALSDRARFLRGVGLLAALDMHALVELAESAREETWPAASDIVEEGAVSDRFYIVRTGDVNVTRLEADGSTPRIARLGPGEWFGEAGLIAGAPRNATVRAGTSRPVQLLAFDAATFERLIEPHVTSADGRELISRRRAQLEAVPLFQALASSDLDRLARVLREAHAPQGTVLFRQGESADSFFVIVEGAVGVVKDGQPIAKLNAGEFFGETALLFTEERTATIATTEDSRFWVLEREAFTTFVRDALLHRRDLMPTVLNRIGSSEPV